MEVRESKEVSHGQQREGSSRAQGHGGQETLVARAKRWYARHSASWPKEKVNKVRAKLGLPQTGGIDRTYILSVANYQMKNALTVDGLAGPITLGHMFPSGHEQTSTTVVNQAASSASAGANEAQSATKAASQSSPSGEEIPYRSKEAEKVLNERYFAPYSQQHHFYEHYRVVLRFKKEVPIEQAQDQAATAARTMAELSDRVVEMLRNWTRDWRKFSGTVDVIIRHPKTNQELVETLSVGLRKLPITKEDDAQIQKHLVTLPSDMCRGGRKIKLMEHAAKAFEQLFAAARNAFADDVKKNPDLFKVTSGFRSYSTQQAIWTRKYNALKKAHPDWDPKKLARETSRWVAKPGYSAHQSGVAVDLYLGYRLSSANVAKIKATKYYEWLTKNAPNWGFTPYEGEGWHWEKLK